MTVNMNIVVMFLLVAGLLVMSNGVLGGNRIPARNGCILGGIAKCCYSGGEISLTHTCTTVTPYYLTIDQVPFNLTFRGYCAPSDLAVNFNRVLESDLIKFRVVFGGWANGHSEINEHFHRLGNYGPYKTESAVRPCGIERDYWVSLSSEGWIRAGVSGVELIPLKLISRVPKNLFVTFNSWTANMFVKNIQVNGTKKQVYFKPGIPCTAIIC